MSEKIWNVVLLRAARKSVDRTETAVCKRILDRLEQLATLENPLRHKDVRALEGKLLGLYRFRIGEYRVIFELDSDKPEIVVHAIEPRGRAY